MTVSVAGFGAYDIRGTYPESVNEELAYRIGRAFPLVFGTKKIAVGHDIRLSGPALSEALVRGLRESGAEVLDIGLCGTEMIYYTVAHEHLSGGIMVTASHNPKEYNGFKFVREEARPISSADGLEDLKEAVLKGEFPAPSALGALEQRDMTESYVETLLSYIDPTALYPYRVVMNAGNGAAGPIVDALAARLPLDIVRLYSEPDGSFPHGVPNPLLPENRAATAEAVRKSGADLGIAWDGDFDRCFLFDEQGNFIEGYYMVGLLAEAFLKKHPGEKIIHDPRCLWNTVEICEANGGTPVCSRSGHSFIKAKMRAENAIYGGEMSAHHYFRDFAYCDSGMIPWLLVVELLSRSGKKISELVAARREKYPVSGEINRKVEGAEALLARLEQKYAAAGGEVSKLDGLSVAFPRWRFNLRRSGTEPLVRLNVETRGDKDLLAEKTAELLAEIDH